AFLNFNEDIPKVLNFWQYSNYTVQKEQPLDDLYLAAARANLGYAADQELTEEQKKEVADWAGEIADLNEGRIPQYVTVPKGTVLKLPGNQTYTTKETEMLSEVAKREQGSPDKAKQLFDLNEDKLKLPDKLPVGATLQLPQHNTPALIMFALLVLFLALV